MAAASSRTRSARGSTSSSGVLEDQAPLRRRRARSARRRSTWATTATRRRGRRRDARSENDQPTGRERRGRREARRSDDARSMSDRAGGGLRRGNVEERDGRRATRQPRTCLDDGEMGDAETAGEPSRPRSRGANEPRGPDYKPSRRSSTRRSRPKISATRTNWSACAAISTSSSRICRAWSRGSPTGCSAA